MTASKKDVTSDWVNPDEIPEPSTDEWAKIIEAAPLRRGRPKADVMKVSTTIRLDLDVIEAFKAKGEGWQSRMNKALRRAAGL